MWKEKNNETGRIDYWDVIKGIGIISIVLGHSCTPAVRWVYTYHLAIFFFVTGFLFNKDKWLDKPFLFIGQKMGKLLPKFIVYSSLLFSLHNLLMKLGIYVGTEPMNFGDWMTCIIGTMFFQYDQIGGALWFVPVLLIAIGIFACIALSVFRLEERGFCGEMTCKIIVTVCACIVGNIGVLYNLAGRELPYHSHTSLLVLPIICIAWLIGESKKNIESWINIWGLVISSTILFYFIYVQKGDIELAREQIIGPYAFYLVTFSGIYVCLYVARIICRISFMKKIIAFIGNYTFEIMAFHFLIFKFIDLLITKIFNMDSIYLSAFPVGYREVWILYLIMGCFVPAFTMKLLEEIIFKLKDN